MYSSSHIQVPDTPGKIVRRKKGNGIYVLYEVALVYDPKRQFNVPKRVIIGKLVSDAADAMMQPNEKFFELFPESRQSLLELPSKRSNTLLVGSYIALASVIRECQLEKLLENACGDKAGLILDLASYCIVMEDNAAQYYPEYARRHPLYTEGMRIVSDSTISRFLSSVDRDQITAFFDAWNNKRDRRERIFISYDSTNKNCQAGDLDFVEFGHAKDDDKLPIVNVAIIYDKTNQVPLFYETYPGSIPDVSQLKQMVEKLTEYGYKNIGIIIDRGYFSRPNIELMDEKGIDFLLMMKGCKKLVSSMIIEKRGTFETDRSCRIGNSNIYGTTLKRPLFEGDTKERYFHLFHSPAKAAAERAELDRKIDQRAEELKTMENMKIAVELGKPYLDYFTCFYQDITENKSDKSKEKIFLFAQEKADVIQKEHEVCGYFCLVSSRKMTAQEAYRLYRGRDVSEKLFRADKTFLSSSAQRIHSNEALQAKLFVEFIALIIRNRFFNLLKEQMERLKTRRNTLTVPGAIRELDKMEMTRLNGGHYLLDHALTKNQKNIFQSFGLSVEKVFEEVKVLTKMPRQKSIESIDAQISACKNKIAKAKAYYNKLCSELQALQEERELVMSQKILAAMKQSGRSYDELMTFLQVPKA